MAIRVILKSYSSQIFSNAVEGNFDEKYIFLENGTFVSVISKNKQLLLLSAFLKSGSILWKIAFKGCVADLRRAYYNEVPKHEQ